MCLVQNDNFTLILRNKFRPEGPAKRRAVAPHNDATPTVNGATGTTGGEVGERKRKRVKKKATGWAVGVGC